MNEADAVAAHRLLNRLTIILGTAKALESRWGRLAPERAATLTASFGGSVEQAVEDAARLRALDDDELTDRLDSLLDAVATAPEWGRLAAPDRRMLLELVEEHAAVAAEELSSIIRGLPLDLVREAQRR